MSPPSTTGSAPVAGEAQWAGAGHPALRPALLLCARRLCARRRDQVLAHGHVTRTAWTTSLLPLYEGALMYGLQAV